MDEGENAGNQIFTFLKSFFLNIFCLWQIICAVQILSSANAFNWEKILSSGIGVTSTGIFTFYQTTKFQFGPNSKKLQTTNSLWSK